MIHRLRVQNFKSIIDVAVDLSPVTVLVGKSGTGKSNFVESIRFLRDFLSSKREMKIADQTWSQLRPVVLPIFDSDQPGTLDLTNDRIAEILDREDAYS